MIDAYEKWVRNIICEELDGKIDEVEKLKIECEKLIRDLGEGLSELKEFLKNCSFVRNAEL